MPIYLTDDHDYTALMPRCVWCDEPTTRRSEYTREPECSDCYEREQARLQDREPDYHAPSAAERMDRAYDALARRRA